MRSTSFTKLDNRGRLLLVTLAHDNRSTSALSPMIFGFTSMHVSVKDSTLKVLSSKIDQISRTSTRLSEV